MIEDDKPFFIKGLKVKMAEMGMKQVDFARYFGMNPVTINRYFKGKSFPDGKSMSIIRSRLGMTEDEIVGIVKPRVLINPQATPPVQVSIPKEYMSADDAAHVLSSLAATVRKMDSRLKYWQQVFEALPVPVIVLRDGLVYSQNRRSRAIWDGLGRSLCSGCQDEKCKDYGCNIKDAIDKGKDIEVYKMIGDDYYKVIATHFSANNHEYTTIVITPIAECKTAMEKLTQIADERAFLESNKYEAAEYYADANRRVSYCNKSFLRLFEIERDDIKTTDDFHILLSRKLFYFQHVAKAADEVREFKRSAEVQAKLTNNKTVHFIFRPHLKDGELQGVLVMVLTPELYEAFNGGE